MVAAMVAVPMVVVVVLLLVMVLLLVEVLVQGLEVAQLVMTTRVRLLAVAVKLVLQRGHRQLPFTIRSRLRQCTRTPTTAVKGWHITSLSSSLLAQESWATSTPRFWCT